MSAETRAATQLRLIREAIDVLSAAGIDSWLRGGWAVDFFLGEITREHQDIDLFAWMADGDRLAASLVQAGHDETAGPPPTTQRNFAKSGEQIHIVLVEKGSQGLVTRGGRWGASQEAIEEWPEGMLDGPPGRIGDLVAPIVAPAALLHMIESTALLPGRPREQKHSRDVDRLRAALGF